MMTTIFIKEDRNRDINIGLHPLKGIKTFQFATWDIEAFEWWNLLVIGCFDGTNYYHFRNVDGFINHILQEKYRSWRWFAHFGGRYDINFIFDRLRERNDLEVEFYCAGSMVIHMTIKQGRRTVYLCDSFRLLPASLRDLTIAFNVQHQKSSMDFTTMTYNLEMLEYNEQDCKGLYEVLDSFFEQTGIRSETFATHALRYWRKEFLRFTIWKPHENVSDFIRKSLHGGHVEVFKRSGFLKAFDVNSMYPYVMQNPIPVHYIGESRRLSEVLYGFVEAIVDVPDMYIPPLPYKIEKLFFPVGRLHGVWTSEELIEAEKRGAKIQKIIKGVYFQTVEIFKEYVEKLYALKRTATEPTRTIAKYLLNSLFGKFGQHPDKKVYVTEDKAPEGSFPIVHPETGKPSGFAYYTRRSRSAYLLPHISAAITSKARLVLLDSLNTQSYYCDTDSIFTTDSMMTGKELGDWSLLGEGDATFYQPKLYKFNGTWKAKGLNTKQSIDAFVQGDINQIIRRKSVKEALRTGTPACADVEIEKRIGFTRPKRIWLADNLDTRPWNVEELD